QASWSEALVRWSLPDGTVRGPADILPHWLSDQRQDTFTRFSVERVAAVLSEHAQAHVSVNLRPAQVTHPQTLTSLEGLLPSVRQRRRVELTEQNFGDTKRLWSSLAAPRERFGARLLDVLTIDAPHHRIPRADVNDAAKRARCATRVLQDAARRPRLERFVRALAGRFAIVVLEGVEDPEICDYVEALGVTLGQGFGIGHPRPELVSPLYEPR